MIFYFRLIRLPNLIMMALCMFLVRYFLILPAFRTEAIITGEYPAHMSKWEFLVLVMSTICIAAAGYIINDIHDVHTDSINKPGKNQIGKKISESIAKYCYYVLNLAGILAGFILAFQIGKPAVGIVQTFTAATLWMYATQYKKRPFTGNLLIALLSGLVPLIPALFEPEFYRNIIYTLLFGFFAFLLTLVREIIKDIEDIDGDELSQYKTLPVRFGLPVTRGILYFILLVTAIFMVYVLHLFFYSNSVINFWYLVAIFEIPFAALAYLVATAKEKKDYSFASQFSKLVLLAGILAIIPFYYYFLI